MQACKTTPMPMSSLILSNSSNFAVKIATIVRVCDYCMVGVVFKASSVL